MAQFQESEADVDNAIAREDEQVEPQADPVEYFEMSDAPSEVATADVSEVVAFDVEPLPSPRIRELPATARPRVLFWLDHEFQVHRLVRKCEGAYFEKAEAIVHAVALHLRNVNAGRLPHAGDWVNIPVITRLEKPKYFPGGEAYASSLQQLLDDVLGDEEKALDIIYWIRKRVGLLRSFAFHLPNGDVVTPQTLMVSAMRSGTRIGAAALRRLTSGWHPAGAQAELFTPGEAECLTLAGETITAPDWQRLICAFEKASKQSGRRSSGKKRHT
jgi:hypothetical protein